MELGEVAGEKFWIRMEGEAGVRSGDRIPIGFDPARVMFFDAKTEARLR